MQSQSKLASSTEPQPPAGLKPKSCRLMEYLQAAPVFGAQQPWVLHDCEVVGAGAAQPNEPAQPWLVGGLAPPQDASPTVAPSERTHATARDCVPDVLA